MKNLLELFRRNTATAVAYTDRDGFRVARLHANRDHALRFGSLFHCIESIEHKIENDLLELNLVSIGTGQVLIEFGFDPDIPHHAVAAQQQNDVVHEICQIEGGKFEFLLFYEGAH